MFPLLEVVQACRSLLLPIVEKLIVWTGENCYVWKLKFPAVFTARRGLVTGTSEKTLSGPSTEDTIPGNLYKLGLSRGDRSFRVPTFIVPGK